MQTARAFNLCGILALVNAKGRADQITLQIELPQMQWSPQICQMMLHIKLKKSLFDPFETQPQRVIQTKNVGMAVRLNPFTV